MGGTECRTTKYSHSQLSRSISDTLVSSFSKKSTTHDVTRGGEVICGQIRLKTVVDVSHDRNNRTLGPGHARPAFTSRASRLQVSIVRVAPRSVGVDEDPSQSCGSLSVWSAVVSRTIVLERTASREQKKRKKGRPITRLVSTNLRLLRLFNRTILTTYLRAPRILKSPSSC